MAAWSRMRALTEPQGSIRISSYCLEQRSELGIDVLLRSRAYLARVSGLPPEQILGPELTGIRIRPNHTLCWIEDGEPTSIQVSLSGAWERMGSYEDAVHDTGRQIGNQLPRRRLRSRAWFAGRHIWRPYAVLRERVIQHLDPELVAAALLAGDTSLVYNLACTEPRFRQLCQVSPITAALVANLVPGRRARLLGLPLDRLFLTICPQARGGQVRSLSPGLRTFLLRAPLAAAYKDESTMTLDAVPGHLLSVQHLIRPDWIRRMTESDWGVFGQAAYANPAIALAVLRNPEAARRAAESFFRPEEERSLLHGDGETVIGQAFDRMTNWAQANPEQAHRSGIRRIARETKRWYWAVEHGLVAREGERLPADDHRFPASRLPELRVGRLGTLRQLRTFGELRAEGAELHNRAAGMWTHCEHGLSFLYSLRRPDGSRLATIELDTNYQLWGAEMEGGKVAPRSVLAALRRALKKPVADLNAKQAQLKRMAEAGFGELAETFDQLIDAEPEKAALKMLDALGLPEQAGETLIDLCWKRHYARFTERQERLYAKHRKLAAV